MAFDAVLEKAPTPVYLWRNRLPAVGMPRSTHPRARAAYSLEAWLLAGNTDNRVVIYQPHAWFLQTDVLGRWRAGVFVGAREFDATSNVVPPRTKLR